MASNRKPIILYRNRVDECNVTASSEIATLPATNVQTQDVSQVWRTDGATSASIVADAGEAVEWGAVALWGHNLSTGAEISVFLSNDDGDGSGDVHASETLTVSETGAELGAFVYFMPDRVARWMRVEISDDSLDYLEVGRLIAGPVFRATRGIEYGSTITFVETGFSARSLGGEEWSSSNSLARQFDGTFGALNLDEIRAHLAKMARYAGRFRGDMLVCLDPGDPDLPAVTLWGRMQVDFAAERRNARWNSLPITILERG